MRIHAAASAALLALAVPARAQETPSPADTTAFALAVPVPADTAPRTSLQKGSWSLSFVPPGYGGGGERAEFGAWEMVGARTNLGLTLAVSVYGSEGEYNGGAATATQASTFVELGMDVRRYVMAPREVTPFLLGGAAIGGRFERRDASNGYDETTRGMNATLRAAAGVEWFPVRRLSISGQTGFSLTAGRFSMEQDAPESPPVSSESSSLGVRSFTSALTLQIYF